MNTRRRFIKTAGTGMIAAAAAPVFNRGFAGSGHTEPAFRLGIAGYTFREFSVEQAIEIMKRINVSYLSLKDFHLPYDSSQEKINEVLQQFASAGISVYTLGVIYMKTKEFVDQAFNYAKMAGVKMIVGAPDYELLDYVEQKVRENDIRIAIHNHGPDNPLYPNATDIWEHIKNSDPRVGICIDIGHTTRDGHNPSEDIENYSKRILDVHIKDVDKSDKTGKTVEMGRGIIDIPGVIGTLRRIEYKGMCSLEFEKDMKDPLAGIAESVGYWKGASAALDTK